MKLTEHFDSNEFVCKCGCGNNYIDKKLVEMLEKLHKDMNAYAIVVNSGYRCPKHSVAVGGFATDAHTVGIAADCVVFKDKYIPYDVETIAEYAERLGFSGIGLMNGNAVHLDIRNNTNYKNSHWFGDERTGENIATFQRKKTHNVSRETIDVKGLQKWLNSNGYNCGTIDGILGVKTLSALRKLTADFS